ncbi:TolC family protein [Clostridium sp. BSD9I1]|uniref:TolC family protein n=1 Tax=Clostridium sp. BSD9I1 TaxID=2003589 RepID=UPI001648AABB|nr:TolC family protein [Clostridium sp. BSD9I1]
MNKKKLLTLLITGLMMLSSINVIAANNNDNTNTLDIEKTAIETIKNSQSVKTLNKRMENAQKQYFDVQSAAQMAIARGISSVQLIIYNPIDARNALNQFITSQQTTTNSVRNDAYSKYITLLKANYAVSIQSELNKSLAKDNENAQVKLNKGLISQNDARLIEINYLKSKYQLSSAEKNLDSAYMIINLAMGEDISQRYTALIDDNIVPTAEIKSLDDYVKAAVANRGEIVNAQNMLDSKKEKFTYDKATYRTDYDNYIEKTQYDIDRAQNDLEQAKIGVELEINNGYKNLQEYMKTAESQQINYDLAKSNYESAKVRYDNDMITLNELQDAQIAKAQAQINLKNAQLDAWLGQAKMDNACGIGPGLK